MMQCTQQEAMYTPPVSGEFLFADADEGIGHSLCTNSRRHYIKWLQQFHHHHGYHTLAKKKKSNSSLLSPSLPFSIVFILPSVTHPTSPFQFTKVDKELVWTINAMLKIISISTIIPWHKPPQFLTPVFLILSLCILCDAPKMCFSTIQLRHDFHLKKRFMW